MYQVPNLELRDPRGSLVLINPTHITKVVPRTVDDSTGPVRSIIYTVDGQRQDVAESVREVKRMWDQQSAAWETHADYVTWQHSQSTREVSDYESGDDSDFSLP